MAPRKEPGIKDLGNGKWLIRYDVYDAEGKRVQRGETFKGTLKQAKFRRQELTLETSKGQVVVPQRMTLEKLLEQWFKHYCKGKRTKNRQTDVNSRIDTHLVPLLGQRQLYELTTYNIQKAIDGIDRSPRTVRGVYETLNMALKYAVKMKLIPSNPAEDIELPSLGKPEIKYWTAEEAKQFLEKGKDSRYRLVYELALGLGMRQGEILGLRWQDVDFAKQRLFVRKTLDFPEGGGWELNPPKTQNSLRVLPLSIKLVALLKSHKAKQDKERLFAGPAWDDYGFVFANSLGHPYNPKNIVNRDFKPLIKNAKVSPIRFHDLRHTYATICLERGMHIKVLSARLGHSSEAFTMTVYAGFSPILEEGTANLLDDVLNV